jgi:capsular exopolysaccharide synthesis family protein
VEAIRGLRTSLLHTQNGPPLKTILITSAGEQEGKSTLSLNLAAALVLNGSRVLLVDGDMRSSGLSGYMGFERKEGVLTGHQKSGLSDALSGPGEPTVIIPFSDLPNLSVLPAGSDPKYPAELLGSKRMQALVGSWAANYDYVLIDSPPTLAVAYRTLRKVEGGNIGIVVNGVRRGSVSFDEFYGYQGTSYYKEA